MWLEHFSHEHPLIPGKEQDKDDGVEVCCYVCKQPISGPCYKCMKCKHFWLHKVCAELPKKMKHPMHPQHQLTLLPILPDTQSPIECSACRRSLESFTYNCSICKFDIDILCALLVHKIEHKFHEHPLTTLQKPGLLLCEACGTTHKGTFFQCTTCHFWINQKCALLPSTIDHPHHIKHRLSLDCSLPYERFKFTPFCKICSKSVEAFWAYYCAECRYYAHVNCLKSNSKLLISSLLPRYYPPAPPPPGKLPPPPPSSLSPTPHHYPRIPPPPPLPLLPRRGSVVQYKTKQMNQSPLREAEYWRLDLIHLPPPDCSFSLKSHVMKRTSLQRKSERSLWYYHTSHRHPLFYTEEQITDESSSTSKLLECDGCTQPISGPFYHCPICPFILHAYCVEFPRKLQHPIHPDHPLKLKIWNSEYSDLPLCQGCKMSCKGVCYGCVPCAFFLDLNCSSLVIHEAHQHSVSLTLRETTEGLCIACHNKVHGAGFVCLICNFKLHSKCAFLPGSVRHRYDEHPFILVYSGSDDEYYCEKCEEEINPNCWFYDCGECRQSFHRECLRPTGLVSSLQKCFITHEAHQHTLTLKESSVPCAACKQDCFGLGFVCEKYCNFALHTRCASLPHTVTLKDGDKPYILTFSGKQFRPNSLEHYYYHHWRFCAICRGKLKPDCWYYHCSDYEQYLHTTCISISEYKDVKFGEKLELGYHRHLVTYVARPEDISPCDECDQLVEGEGFECEVCSFRLHKLCAFTAANYKSILEHQKGDHQP